MDTKPRTTPKDFFLHLGTMVGLYISAGSLIALLFQVINYAFPDRLAYYGDPYSAGIKFAIASLVVVFPLFLYLGRLLQKDLAINPEKRDLWVRKWLVYLTLFIASAVIVGDLIALINTFLGGEITVRFILKVLTILVVLGLIFGYYIADIRRPEGTSGRLKSFGTVAFILVLASIIAGFYVMGSPSSQRKLRFDSMRVNDLQSIQWQIVSYWQQKEALPEKLEDLRDPISGFISPVDPKTDAPYGYRKIDKDSFELCADFELPTPDVRYRGNYRGDYSYPFPETPESWDHGSGKTCFTRDIDPERYPPVTKMRLQ